MTWRSFSLLLALVSSGVLAASCSKASVSYERTDPSETVEIEAGTARRQGPPPWANNRKVPPGLAKKGIYIGMPYKEFEDCASKDIVEVRVANGNGEVILRGESRRSLVNAHFEAGVLVAWSDDAGRAEPAGKGRGNGKSRKL